MNNMYEGKYIINSFYAVDAASGQQITPDEEGYITLEQGQKVIFKSLYGNEYVNVNTLVFFAEAESSVKVQLNDNTLYPFYVEAGTKRGVKNMRIYSFTALTGCTLYYEGIVC